jgi:hypothetical protein
MRDPLKPVPSAHIIYLLYHIIRFPVFRARARARLSLFQHEQGHDRFGHGHAHGHGHEKTNELVTNCREFMYLSLIKRLYVRLNFEIQKNIDTIVERGLYGVR